MEFAQQFLLRAALHIPEDVIAICLVAHHNPALPAVVFLFSYHAVAGWPAFCHDDVPPLQQHNISQKERTIQGHGELLSKKLSFGVANTVAINQKFFCDKPKYMVYCLHKVAEVVAWIYTIR